MRIAARLLAALATLSGIGCAIAAPPPDSDVLPPAAPGGEFAQADRPRDFTFPGDHGPHPGFRQEWWYVTGNLDGPQARRFGFELTFFRYALAPPAPAAPEDSAWRSRTLLLAHFAVTDPERHRFVHAQKLSREALGIAGAQGAPPRVWIDDWMLAAEGDAQGWKLTASQPGYAVDLVLTLESAPVLNGAAGLSQKSDAPGSASYYYSVPRLAVSGHLTRAGVSLPVHGEAWLDREWGSGGLGPGQVGWDWFALQLRDGSTLMLYELRRRDGKRDAHSAGTWCDTEGRCRPLRADQVAVAASGSWRNARGDTYPSGWRVGVPALSLELTVRPVLADQELATRPRYWEGAVDVSGTRAGARLDGRGYVELVGYASGS